MNSVDAATKTLEDRLHRSQGRRRERHPAAARRRDRADRGRRRPHRLVPGRSGDLRVEAACRTSTCSAMPPSWAAMPKSAFSANAQAKVCAAAVAALLAGRDAGRAAADQHLLQPGRARLRHHGRGRIQAEGRRARRHRRRGRRQPARCAARERARSKRNSPKAGSRRSRARCSAEAVGDSGRASGSARRSAPAQELRPYTVTGDAIPQSLTGAPGDAERGRRS